MYSYYLLDISQPIEFRGAGKSQADDSTWQHYERIIDDYILFLVLDGSLNLMVDNKPYSMYPGDILFMRAGAHHVGFHPGVVTFYWMHCYPWQISFLTHEQADIFHQKNSDAKKMLLPIHFHMKQLENIVILLNHLIHYCCINPKNPINDYLATAILIEISNQFDFREHTATSEKKRRFEEIVSYIRANYREELKVSEIAWKFNYNKKYLSRLFHNHIHCSVKDFITDTRLRVAERLLLSTNDTISAIAKNSGFASEYTFMRTFKKKYNISPTQYRNTYYLQQITKYKSF